MCIIPPTAAKDSVAALDQSPCKTLLLSTSLGDILSSPSSLCYELCDSRRKSGCYCRSDCIICSVTISGTTDIVVSYQSMLGDCVWCNRVRCAAVTSGSGRRWRGYGIRLSCCENHEGAKQWYGSKRQHRQSIVRFGGCEGRWCEPSLTNDFWYILKREGGRTEKCQCS